MNNIIPVFLDVETTSNELNEPVEIYYEILDGGTSREFHSYLNPEEKCLPIALSIHGLIPDFLAKHEAIGSGLRSSVSELLDNQDRYCIIGYNVSFDIGVIHDSCSRYCQVEYNPEHSVDVMALVKKLIPRKELGSYGLDAVYCYLFPDKVEYLLKSRASHSAKTDIKLTMEVYTKLFSMVRELNPDIINLSDLEEFSKAPTMLDMWPFGKHKGKTIDFVLSNDKQYANWFLYKADFKKEWPDLLYTLKEKLKR